MRLSHESETTRRLAIVAVCLLAAWLLTMHARSVRDYLNLVGQLGLRGQVEAPTPLKMIFPTFATDAQVWVRHSLSLLEGHELRLRHTDIDNALEGREVHWNSAWAWTIAGSGKLYQAMNGGTLEAGVEKATIWLGPMTLLLLIVLVSTWTSRRAGALAGVFIGAAMVLHEPILEGFFASYCDHHGLLTVSVLGVVLGGAMMAGGWWRAGDATVPGFVPTSADAVRSGATLSAISGALGIWVSAASVIPAVAIMGASGLVATLMFGRAAKARGETFDARAWIIWGRIGAALSIFFYLVEYFPQYLGWRLEVNHPLYALAWLAGGEFIARASEHWIGNADPGRSVVRSLLWPTLAIIPVPMIIVVFGPKVWALADPFMAQLHRGIDQFHPLWKRIEVFDNQALLEVVVVALPFFAALVTMLRLRRATPMALAVTAMAGGALFAMSVWQVRWILNAGAGEVVLAMVLIACWTANRSTALRWGVATAIMLLIYAPGGISSLMKAASSVSERRVTLLDAKVALTRDIAAMIRASQPSGDIVLLTGPDTSTTVGYYGRFRLLGTSYWENGAGLKAAAAIWSAKSDEDAARMMREHGVTHIVLLNGEDFIEPYYELLNPRGGNAADFDATLGGRVLQHKTLPTWLQPIPYEIPADLKTQGFEVQIYKVDLPR